MLTALYALVMRNTFVVAITLFFLSCQVRPFEYQISDSYTGPCVVFVMEKEKFKTISDSVILENGLGVIGRNVLGKNYLFRSIETGNVFEIVKIGSEINVPDSGRYVFQLALGTENNQCATNIRAVTFFIGSKTAFLAWSDKPRDEFAYFDSIGINLCNYYKSRL